MSILARRQKVASVNYLAASTSAAVTGVTSIKLQKDRTVFRYLLNLSATLTAGAGTLAYGRDGGIESFASMIKLGDGAKSIFAAGSYGLKKVYEYRIGNPIYTVQAASGTVYGGATDFSVNVTVPVEFTSRDLDPEFQFEALVNHRVQNQPELFFTFDFDALTNIYTGSTVTVKSGTTPTVDIYEDMSQAGDFNNIYPTNSILQFSQPISSATTTYPGQEIILPSVGSIRRVHLFARNGGVVSDGVIGNITLRRSGVLDQDINLPWASLRDAYLLPTRPALYTASASVTGWRVLDHETLRLPIDRINAADETRLSLFYTTVSSLPGGTNQLDYIIERIDAPLWGV